MNSVPARTPTALAGAGHTGAVFATTRWSLVLGAGTVTGAAKDPGRSSRSVGSDGGDGQGDDSDRQAALAALCQIYWPPVYAYVRRFGVAPADAEDLTQEFFRRLLAREFFSQAEPEKGRFRTFLLCSLKHFLQDEHLRARAQKRGGGRVISLDELVAEQAYQAEPAHGLNPEMLFERKWAYQLLERALGRAEAEFSQGARSGLFAALRQRLWGGHRGEPAHALAARFGLSESAVHVMMHRLRARFRELLREEVAELVGSPAEIEDELRHFLRVLGSPT